MRAVVWKVLQLTIQLEDLFVDEQQRGKGLGKRLFGELGKLAKEKECGRVEWRVLKVRSHHPAELCMVRLSVDRKAALEMVADEIVEPAQYRLLRKVPQGRAAGRVGDDACRGQGWDGQAGGDAERVRACIEADTTKSSECTPAAVRPAASDSLGSVW